MTSAGRAATSARSIRRCAKPPTAKGSGRALRDGEIDTVATDHVHRDISAKAGGIWTASPGCPGLETLLPVLLSEGHHKRGLPLERIVEVAATNPARIMGLGHAKGSIAPGLDADLALVDLDAEWTLQRSDVVSSAGYSIYEGAALHGPYSPRLRTWPRGVARRHARGRCRRSRPLHPATPAVAIRRRTLLRSRDATRLGRDFAGVFNVGCKQRRKRPVKLEVPVQDEGLPNGWPAA